MRITQLLAMFVLALSAAALSAQATVNLGGTVPEDERDWFLFSVDFNTSASVSLDLTIMATGGTGGLDVALVDLDELAANGTTSAAQSDSDSGTGTINLTLTTATYSGVVDFGILVETLGPGTSPYSGTLSTSDTAVSSITANGTQTTSIASPNFAVAVLGRVADSAREHTGARTTTTNITVDYGTGAQAMTFYVNAGGLGDGSVEVYEVDAGDVEQLLGTLSGTSFWGQAGNFTTSSRTGDVTIRIKLISPGAAIIGARSIYPSSVTVVSASGPGGGGGGGGGGGDDGCSTSGNQGLSMLALLGLIGAIGLAARLRGS